MTNKEYQKNNKGKTVAKTKRRELSKINRTPPWLNKDQLIQIEEFYIKAAELTKQTNIKYHVDHIIPLQGKNVSGLHVPWNLQVIPASENLSKSNKF